MEDIRFRCPACRGKLVVDARYAGETASCPKCSQAVAIPRPRPGVTEDLTRTLEKTRQALDVAAAKEAETASQAAELESQLGEAKETLAGAEKAYTEKIAAFEEELKREKAALALETQAHKKLELQAEDLAHQAENAAREEVGALKEVVESKTSQVERLQNDIKKQREALETREAEVAAMKKQQSSQGGTSSSSQDVKHLEQELEAQRQVADDIEKDKAILFDEVSGLRKKVREQEELLKRSDPDTGWPRASRNDFSKGQMRLLDQKLTDQLAALERQLTEFDVSGVGDDERDGLARMQAETQRLAKAHSIQLEVQRLERKLRDEQRISAERSRKEMEQRQSELSDEIAKLRSQLEVKDHAMREVVDGARTPIDLSGYANPTLEKLAAAQAEQQASSDDGEEAPAADGTLTPLKGVGEDLLPRFTSPRPYYHELPQAKPNKSWVLTLGWILAGFGIVAMILSPAKLLPVYAPPVTVALLVGIALWFRRRTPMVAGLVFLTILIPAMVWFGVEQAHFEGLAPELGVDVEFPTFD